MGKEICIENIKKTAAIHFIERKGKVMIMIADRKKGCEKVMSGGQFSIKKIKKALETIENTTKKTKKD